MNKDLQNLNFQYNKYIYPKPIENIEKEILNNYRTLSSDPNFSWHLLWPEKPYSVKKLNVLVAGCGSDQASVLARCNPKHNFVGIDLSQQSINHQNKLKKKYKLNNLKLICDDFRKIIFKKKFDYIISTGVIHHLIDPGSALEYFYTNLKNKGVVYLMVYGDKLSNSIKEITKIFKTLKFKQNNQSIEIAKKTILNLNSEHPAKIFSKNTSDFNHSAGIVDFLLHNQEKFFQIKELIKLLKKNKFVIKNFVDGRISSVTKFFLEDVDCINNIRKLPPNKKLELGQILNWNDRNIKIIICKDNNVSDSLLYNKIKMENIYIFPNRSLDYKINKESIIVKEKNPEIEWKINIPNNLFINWKTIFEGKTTLSNSFIHYDDQMKKKAKKIFEILIENHFVDVSLNPIGNYLKNYGK